MDFVVLMILLGISGAPLACLALTQKIDHVVPYSILTFVATTLFSSITTGIGFLFGDFHMAAFALQLIAPIEYASGMIALIVGDILILKKKNFFTKKRVKIILETLATVIVVGVAGYTGYRAWEERGFDAHPDIEFYGYSTDDYKKEKTVYYRQNGADNTITKVGEGEYVDKYRVIVLTNPQTGKEIPLCNVIYNKDETAIYFEDGRKVYRYDKKDKSYEEILELEPVKKGCSHYVRDMVVSSDEKFLYYTVGRTDGSTDEYKVMYSCNLETKEIKLLVSDNSWIQNLALSPDDKTLYYFGGGINAYDVETGKTHIVCAFPMACVKATSRDFPMSVSPDGRFIIYCEGTVERYYNNYSVVYAYDMKTHRAGAIIKTDKCYIDHVEWAK